MRHFGQRQIKSAKPALMQLALIVIVLSLQASGFADTVSLLLQQTPPNGGEINPGVGVHDLLTDSYMTLTAVAKPGYQFVYWLGDVSDPTSNSTVVSGDSSKIVIAVFERVEYEHLVAAETINSAGGGGLRRSAADYSRQGGGGGAGRKRPKYRYPSYESDPFPVPENNDLISDEFPVPESIPEPATGAIFTLGLLMVTRIRRKKAN
jgi:hypothetical protein